MLVGSLALAASASADSAPPEGAPVVKLLSAGKGPKTALRMSAKQGDHQTLVMTIAMGMGIQTDGKDTLPMMHMPAMQMTMEVDVVSIAGNGDIRCNLEISKVDLAPDPSANPAVASAMKHALAGLTGLTGYTVITNRGFTREADFTIGPNADPQLTEMLNSMRQSLRQLSSPLPDEPVGKDAQWMTTMKLKVNGMAMTQVSTHRLLERSGNSAKIELSLKQTAGRQKIQRNGVTVDLFSLSSTGSGAQTFDLSHAVPAAAHVAITSVSDMEAMGQKMTLKLDVAMDVNSH